MAIQLPLSNIFELSRGKTTCLRQRIRDTATAFLNAGHQSRLVQRRHVDYSPVIYTPKHLVALNRKTQGSLPITFDARVTEIRKTSTLLNIRDDANKSMIDMFFTKVDELCVQHTMQFNDSLHMSRQPLTDAIQYVRSISELAGFELPTQGKSHPSQQKGSVCR
jgi:hypothetical protein